jgi:PAS domain S-box-containing protein
MQLTAAIATTLPAGSLPLLVLGTGVVLIALAVLFFALMLLSRRQARRDMREIVVAVEELRAGSTQRRAELTSRSPLAVVADAVNRLVQDVGVRLDRARTERGRLEAFTESIRDYAVIATDSDWDVRSFSAGGTFLFGWGEEEILGRPASVLFDEESWKNLLPKLARRTLREQGVEMRADMVRRDGSGFNGEIIVRLLVGDRGREPSGYMIVVRDVTSQVQLEQELRESELRYRSLVEGLAEGVFILQEGRIAYANPAMRELAGHTNETLVGHLLIEHIATADLLVVEDALSRLAHHPGDEAVLRCTLIDHDREPLAVVRMQATGIVHEGKPAVLVSVFDETIDRQVEGELRRNEARLDAVLEATSDGIVVFSDAHDAGIIRMTNRAFVEMFGLEADRVLGSAEDDLMEALRQRGGGAEAVASFLEGAGVVPRIETVNVDGKDEPRVIELKVAPLMGRNGELLGRVLACRDLTDWKVFERNLEANADRLRESNEELEASHAKLREVNAELLERAERVELLNRELKTLDEMKSSLLGNVSHELQTPLVSIRGYTEMILKGRLGPTTDEQRKGLTLALKNIDRLISMIDNLLAFARMEGEAAEIKITTFPLRPMIQEVVELLRDKATARSIAISVELAEGEMIVQGDRDRIHQVFLNLISNAIKFNRADGSVVVAARPEKPGYARVEVRDTGIGIPEDETDRIFDRYYQVGVETPSDETGSGIGLAIVRDILRLHGCTIRVESRVAQGSVFSFTLPLAEGQGEEVATGGNGDPEPDDNDTPDTDGTPQTPKKPRFRIIRHN